MSKFIFDKSDFLAELKWVLLFRTIITIVLFFSTFLFCTSKGISYFTTPFLYIFIISMLIFLTSILYFFFLAKGVQNFYFIYCWAILETFFVTGIIFVTGGIESIFTFLYLIIIICFSIFLSFKGSLIIATISSFQYGLFVLFNYYGFLNLRIDHSNYMPIYNLSYVVVKIIIVVVACYAIALLSGILALNAKNVKHDLKVTQGHLKRVERMSAVDEMLSGITHEIKNPLASLSGSIQLLKENAEPGSSDYRLMQIVLRETQRLQSIVNNFRLFIKPGTKDATLTRLDISIIEIVELFLNAPEYNDNFKVVTKVDDNILVKIDPIHFKQIMWNLLMNAAQAMDNTGEIQITLNQPSKDRVYLNVIDTGCGIQKENMASVFDPFFTTKEDGTGLGLSIVHKLVDLYHGTIDFESLSGSGTAFTVIFKGYVKNS